MSVGILLVLLLNWERMKREESLGLEGESGVLWFIFIIFTIFLGISFDGGVSNDGGLRGSEGVRIVVVGLWMILQTFLGI